SMFATEVDVRKLENPPHQTAPAAAGGLGAKARKALRMKRTSASGLSLTGSPSITAGMLERDRILIRLAGRVVTAGSLRQSLNTAWAARRTACPASDVFMDAASSPVFSSITLEIIGLISTSASVRCSAWPSRENRIRPEKARFRARRA